MSANFSSIPLVSVIIPTYNRLNYLSMAISSVLQQTMQDFEIIVSDDGSTESPQSLVKSFNDPRILFRQNSSNLGIAQNISIALEIACGKYIAILNDDDLWTERFLEALVAPLEENVSLVLAFCDYWVIDTAGSINKKLSEKQTRKEKRDRLQKGTYQAFWEIGLVNQAVFASSAAVLRRQVIEWEELPNAGVFWDYYLVYLACQSRQGAYYVPERLAKYRIHSQSENMLSGSRNAQAKIRKGKAGLFCYQQFAINAPQADLRSHFEREWAHANTTLAIGLMRDRQYSVARPYLWRSLRAQPLNLRTLIALALSYMPLSFAHALIHLRDPGVLSKAR